MMSSATIFGFIVGLGLPLLVLVILWDRVKAMREKRKGLIMRWLNKK